MKFLIRSASSPFLARHVAPAGLSRRSWGPGSVGAGQEVRAVLAPSLSGDRGDLLAWAPWGGGVGPLQPSTHRFSDIRAGSRVVESEKATDRLFL